MVKTLKHPFMRVQTEDGRSYGGNQSWLPHAYLRGAGCGVISATDTLLYMCSYHESCRKQRPDTDPDFLTKERYVETASAMAKRYFPVFPHFGINGLMLVLGMNFYFIHRKLPFRASWGVPAERLWATIDDMLDNDIPVILSVGPNFPKIWKKEKLPFYTKRADGAYIEAAKTKAHYVTVTERDGTWLTISSWGKKYYVNLMEYRAYIKRHSSGLVSNLVYIKSI